ncbi:MAG: hypothetical protein GF353_25245, partial [Candidatus Lokiarchaeota archaeon]|nr:hypothetical protein [Candidatus Lokiarchaeota archaeon]
MINSNSGTGYDRLKRLAKERNCRVKDLLVLSNQNDAFYIGTKTQKKQGEWFAELWNRFGYETGVHLRRIHYQAVSDEVVKPDGKRYENTIEDWALLNASGRFARYLSFVDPLAFVDKRNPEPHIFFDYENENNNVNWTVSGSFYNEWDIPEINTDLTYYADWEFPWFSINGYQYTENLQPYHIEIWEEKSTMDDVLIPLCRKYCVNLVTGLGYLSITRVMELFERVARSGKPTIIFYISDFDPAGIHMPKQIARQIEFWTSEHKIDSEIKLNPLVLTKEQVVEYKLPRVPIKESDKRKQNFEDIFGEGAVELDALEALHRGTLKNIVEKAINEYRDEDLANELNSARKEAHEKLQLIWDGIKQKYQAQ